MFQHPKISKRVETWHSAKPQRWNEPICKLHRTCPNAGRFPLETSDEGRRKTIGWFKRNIYSFCKFPLDPILKIHDQLLAKRKATSLWVPLVFGVSINLWLSRLKFLWRKTLLATVACHSKISKHPRVPMSHQSLKIGYPKIPWFARIMLYLRVTIELWVHSLFGTSQPQKLKQKVDQVDYVPPKMNKFMASGGGR